MLKKMISLLTTSKQENELQPHLHKGEAGQGLVEYALTLTLVTMALMPSLTLIGVGVKEIYCTTMNAISPRSGVA